jgi:hypothetical protein
VFISSYRCTRSSLPLAEFLEHMQLVGFDGRETAPVQQEETGVDCRQRAQCLGCQHFVPPLEAAVCTDIFVTETQRGAMQWPLPFLWHKIIFRTKGRRRCGEQVLFLARCTVSRKITLASFVRCFNSNLMLDSCIQNYLSVLQTFFVVTFVNLFCGLLGYDAVSFADVYQRFASSYLFHLQD